MKKEIESLPEIRYIAVNDIEPNNGQIPGVPKNPRKISKQQFELLMKSIEDDPFLEELKEIWVKPVDGKYVAVDGNMRIRAHKKLGHTECLCKIIPEDWTPHQIKTAILKANTTFGDWDDDLLRDTEWDDVNFAECGLDLPDLDNTFTEQREAEDDNYEPLPPKNPKTKAGDIYILGDHRLICGDSTDEATVAKVMDGELADLWLTDPPYNVKYGEKERAMKERIGEGHVHDDIANDNMSSEEFFNFLVSAYKPAAQNLKPGGAFYIWHASFEAVNFINATKEVGLLFKQMLFWNKGHFVLGRQDYQNKHEPCLYGWKEGAGHYFTARRDLSTVIESKEQVDLEKMSKAEMKELLERILQLPTTVIDEKKPNASIEHPTMKPIPLFGRLINNSTRPGETVLDTFGGSGTTLIACEQLGRKCRMVELSPEYCDVIVDRWEAWTGKKAVKL